MKKAYQNIFLLLVLTNITQLLSQEIGPWEESNSFIEYKGVFVNAQLIHGIAVDDFDRVWVGSWGGDLTVYNINGEELFVVDSVNIALPDGKDSTIYLNACRGLSIAKNGNIIYTQTGSLLELNKSDGSVLNYLTFPGSSPTAPAVDDNGFIYVGHVVGIQPIWVIDPDNFQKISQIDNLYPLAGEFARGIYVSPDGSRFVPANLDAGIHKLYSYDITDTSQVISPEDSIYYNAVGNPILTTQSVTIDASSGRSMWVSQDNAYAAPGPDQDDNAVIGFFWDTYKYVKILMPQSGPQKYDGPRGAAFNSYGTCMFVASWNAGAVFVFGSFGCDANVLNIENVSKNFASEFKLSQNYPNPFNSETTIKYQLFQPGHVSLNIYQTNGQEIKRLVDESKQIGIYTVKWNAAEIASGEYILKMVFNNKTSTRKLIVIK